jgi:hypothetical protein
MNLEQFKATVSLIGIITNALDLATPTAELVKKYEFDFDNGTGADQAQVFFSDTRTLAGSTNESLDLAGGLAAPLGGSITFTAIKAIVVKAKDTNTGNLRVGAGVSNAFQGFFGASAIGNLVTPGGVLVLIDPSATGQAVTGGTGDLLRIENLSAGASDYDIFVLGEGTVA